MGRLLRHRESCGEMTHQRLPPAPRLPLPRQVVRASSGLLLLPSRALSQAPPGPQHPLALGLPPQEPDASCETLRRRALWMAYGSEYAKHEARKFNRRQRELVEDHAHAVAGEGGKAT